MFQARHAHTRDHLVWTDPSLKSTPQLFRCRCGRTCRWLGDRCLGEAPPAEDINAIYSARIGRPRSRAPHSWRTSASRRRAESPRELPRSSRSMTTEDARRVLEALPRDDEPSRTHLSDLMAATGLPAETVEEALVHLGDLGLLIVDKADRDPFHPAEAKYYHAGRIFVRRP